MSVALYCVLTALLYWTVRSEATICRPSGDLSKSTTILEAIGGSSVDLPCLGAERVGFVGSVTWRRGRCDSGGPVRPHQAVSSSATAVMLSHHTSQAQPATDSRMSLQLYTQALHIRHVSTADTAIYYCHVNGADQPLSSVWLQVQGPSEAPGRPMVLGFSSRESNISWTQPKQTNFSPIDHYLVHIRSTEASVWLRSVATPSNSCRLTVDQLQPYTVYSFSVAAVNSFGAGRISQPSYPIQTLREPPSSSVQDLRVTNRDTRQMVLAWRPPAVGTLHGEFLGYHLGYNTSGQTTAQLIITDHSVTSLRITGLNPLSSYRFTVAVKNPEGVGPSVHVTESTLPAVPERPSSLLIQEVGSTWVTVVWQPPTKTNSVITHYVISLADGRQEKQFLVSSNGEDRFEYKLNELEPYKLYNISVYGHSQVGSGERRTTTIRTDTTAPHRPRLTEVLCDGPGSVRVRWADSALATQPAPTFYIVAYRNARWKKYQQTVVPFQADQHKTILHNLDSGIVYLRVKSVRKSIHSDRILGSEFSDTWNILLSSSLNSGCEGFQVIWPKNSGSSLHLAIGIIATLAVLTGITVCVLLIRRKCRISSRFNVTKRVSQ